jgi:hypothetical protein
VIGAGATTCQAPCAVYQSFTTLADDSAGDLRSRRPPERQASGNFRRAYSAISFGEGTIMSIHMPTALPSQSVPAETESRSTDREWLATALTVLFAATAVLLVSFIAVVAGLV